MDARGSALARDAGSLAGGGRGRGRGRGRGTGRAGDGTGGTDARATGRTAIAIDEMDDMMALASVGGRRCRRVVVVLDLVLASADAVEARARAVARAAVSGAGRVRDAHATWMTMCTTLETTRAVVAIEMIVEAATGEDDATARSRAPSRAPRRTAARPHPRADARDIDLDDRSTPSRPSRIPCDDAAPRARSVAVPLASRSRPPPPPHRPHSRARASVRPSPSSPAPHDHPRARRRRRGRLRRRRRALCPARDLSSHHSQRASARRSTNSRRHRARGARRAGKRAVVVRRDRTRDRGHGGEPGGV